MLSNLCVLVVGHDDHERDTLEVCLRELGAYAVVVPSAAEAMRALRLVHVDAAIVSTGRSPSRGGTMLRCMRTSGQRFPAIALMSARAVDGDARARRAGFEGHLVSSLDLDVLEATLRRAVTASRRAQAAATALAPADR